MGDLGWLDETYPELRAAPPWVMAEMVEATPELARPTLAAPEAEAVAAAVLQAAAAGRPIVAVGCGTSLHGAMAVADLLEEALGLAGRPAPVEARDALEAALAPRVRGGAVGISHDGGTPATRLALSAAAATGARTALITHRPDGGVAGPAERGGWAGLHPGTTRADLARAAVEGVLFAVGAATALLAGPADEPVVLTGGGARSVVVQQLVADVLRRPVRHLRLRSASAVGAAVLAGRGVGLDVVPRRDTGPLLEPRPDARLDAAQRRWGER